MMLMNQCVKVATKHWCEGNSNFIAGVVLISMVIILYSEINMLN